ncbi:TPA: transcriptional regulator [Citrobacter freundii]|uniref:helix-turn-helix domain-containing protein n=1 Tax=Citrobacter freundii TaxID=546 RepID=UPI001A94968F|nr:transcriptional regulator [Citrobacter freundii]MBO0957309.1 transcriptional regulator [Citrobacter freundii]MEB0937585.1 transcriptional regulator [Citrobacter freundii]HCB2882994.1 transcriptional regulator [Citrobacter freundii]HEG1880923.1 transcriptional regulator [Citrobacter freundii]
MANWRIIKTKDEYDVAMARIIELATSGLEADTEKMDEFELLTLLVGHYEDANCKMDKPDPIEAIKFRMDQQGLTPADMKQFIGSASKVSEVLNRKRPLSLSMIRRIHNGLGIPADILIKDVNELEWTHLDSSDDRLERVEFLVSSQMELAARFDNMPVLVARSRSIRKRFIAPIVTEATSAEAKLPKENFSFSRVAKIFGGVISTKDHSSDKHYLDEGFSIIS